MRILSIDFDYLVATNIDTRALKFPDGGNENLPKEVQNLIWTMRYGENPEIAEIGILKNALQHIIKVAEENEGRYALMTANSHATLGAYLLQTVGKDTKPFEIVNVDFHSDLYNIGEELNCGNWANKVLEYTEKVKLFWIKREDSTSDEISALPYKDRVVVSDRIEDVRGKFDIIYLFRSDMWTPPHLDKEFEKLTEKLIKYANILFLDNLNDRYEEIMPAIEKYKSDLKELDKLNII